MLPFLSGTAPSFPLWAPLMASIPSPTPTPPALMSMQVVKMEITWIMTQLTLREPRHFSRGKGSNYKQKPEIFHPEGGPCHCWYLQPWESSFFFFAKAEELPSNTRKAFVQKYLLGGGRGPRGKDYKEITTVPVRSCELPVTLGIQAHPGGPGRGGYELLGGVIWEHSRTQSGGVPLQVRLGRHVLEVEPWSR